MGYGHLDDGLAVLFAVLAVRWAVRGCPLLTGLAVGLSIDAKPWAQIFLPVLLAAGQAAWKSPAQAARPARQSVRAWAVAAGCAAAVIAAGWLPFFLADPGTVAALHYAIVNLPDSALRALGVTTARTPSWDRTAQVDLGCVLGGLAIWRGRWPAVIMLGVAARIGLDPAAHGYYTAGLLAGALLWDLLGVRRPVPIWSLLSFGALNLAALLIPDPAGRGFLRLGLVAVITLAVLPGPARWYWTTQVPDAARPTGENAAGPAGRAAIGRNTS